MRRTCATDKNLPTWPFSTISTRRQRFSFESGRVSMIVTVSPTPHACSLIVRMELGGAGDHLAVERVLLALLDLYHAGLVAGGRNDHTLTDLAAVALGQSLALLMSLRRGCFALSAKLAGAHLGVQTRDVFLHGRDTAGIVQLAGGELEPEVEQLGTSVLELLSNSASPSLAISVVLHLRLPADSARVTNFVLIGSLCAASAWPLWPPPQTRLQSRTSRGLA
jgi:hypothetical protein